MLCSDACMEIVASQALVVENSVKCYFETTVQVMVSFFADNRLI